MDQERREAELKDGAEEDDVIPSSQGEMFSSQSSTPDLLSPSRLIPILQPSQSITGSDSDPPPHQPRTGELLGSTPSTSRLDAPSPSAEVRLDLSDTLSDVQPAPSSPAPAAPLKRPLPAEAAATPPEKRPRPAVPSLDDSDVQFVEEVGPDVQVVYSSQEPTSAAPAAAADSQAGFRLSLSPTQSEEVPPPPAVLAVSPAAAGSGPAAPDPPADSASETLIDLPGSPADTRTSTGDRQVGGLSPGSPAYPPAEESQPKDPLRERPSDQPSDRPVAEPAELSGSQGFQPPAVADGSETRLPHIQTPQVNSSSSSGGDSASSPGGGTVFGHAQRLIEEHNRRQELRDRQERQSHPPRQEDRRPEVMPVELEAAEREESAVVALEEDKPASVTAEGDKPASVAVEDDKPALITLEEKPPLITLEADKPILAPVKGDEPVPVASLTKRPGSVVSEEPGSVSSPGQRKPAPTTAALAEKVASTSATPMAERRDVSDPSAVEKDVPGPSVEKDVPEPPVEKDLAAARQDGEEEPSDSQPGSQASGSSLLAHWRSQMRSPSRTAELSEGPPEEAAGTGAAAAAVESGAGTAQAAAGERTERPEAEAMETGESRRELGEDPLPGESAADDPYRFHGTQSQETQPYRLRQPLKDLSTEAKRLSAEGYGLLEMKLTWRKDDKTVTKAFALDEVEGVEFLQRIVSSSSSSGSSLLSGTGYVADKSSSGSGSGSGSGPANKRQSTLSSATLSTIEGRGARHSVSSSVDALPAPCRRSVLTVPPDSPGSDGEVQVLSPPRRRLPPVPEFTSPFGRPPRPHGQPSAVSSLRSKLEEPGEGGEWSASQAPPPDLAGPPAATSTQTERPALSGLPGSQGSGSTGSHVTGSSTSPEIGLQPAPVPAGEPRPLTDREEEELSEREQSQLVTRQLEAGDPCFALWGADKTYYPGRLVSEGRADRWLVRFDDGTERQVPVEHILPVLHLWKGLSVFVQSQRNVYEAGIITGHRMSLDPGEQLDYIVSVDSRPNVTSAVPRSWLSLTRDQASLIRERRHRSLGQLAVGSPSRDVSLDNLVSGRRRAAGAGGGRRLANFETSASDAAADSAADFTTASRAASIPAASRRKGGKGGKGKGKSLSRGSRGKAAEAAKKTSGTSAAAGEPTSPAGGGTKCSVSEQQLRAGRSADSLATPEELTAASETSPAAGRRNRRGSRAKPGSTPAAAAPAEEGATATPSGRGKKRVTVSTPTDEAAALVSTPGGRSRKQGGTSAQKASEPVATPASRSGRGKKRAAPTNSSSSPDQAEATPRRRGSAARASSSAQKQSEPEPGPGPAVAVPGGRRSRKRLALTPAADDITRGQPEPVQIRPLGDVPDEETTLLAKHTFILTCVDTAAANRRQNQQRQLLPPFDKQHVIDHIEARGGHVLPEATLDAAAVQRVQRQGDLLLISNGPLRTTKYISCLAMGVPCVELSWLVTSINEDCCKPYEDYLLPAGLHPVSGELLEQQLVAAPPLAGLRVLVAASPRSDWGRMMGHILAAAGATVKLDNQDPACADQPSPADVVVAEAGCPPAVLSWARLCSTPVVSGEWVIDSVIAHRKLGFSARPEFDFRSKS